MLGPIKLRRLEQPIAVSIEELVPAKHFYRHLDRTLDVSFVRDLVRDHYANGGRPSIDPIVFFKLQLIMFFEGLRSERQLMQVAADRLSLRWYIGYGFDEPLPDHSSLTRIRDRLGLEVFERFFEHVVARCQQAGLVWGQELFFDATKGRANADLDSLVPRFYWRAQQHLDALFAGGDGEPAAPTPDAMPDSISGPDSAAQASQPTNLPVPLTSDERAQLATENDGHWRLLDELRLDPERPPSGPYRRITDYRVSTTDPDATPMNVGGRSALGYHDHYVVDGGKARIIMAALVTPADVMENVPMLDLLRRVWFRSRVRPRRAVGDTTYGTGENIRELEEAGIRAYVPLADFEQNSSFFVQKDFTYDRERDIYTCPRGQPLHYRGNSYTTRVRIYQAPTAACRACPVRAQCTESTGGRKLNRHFDEDYREVARTYHATPAYQKAMRKRQVWVEPLFGEAKDWHGLRRFRLRGLAKVNMEGLRVATGQNLKRLLKKRGWGRRPWPTGTPEAVRMALCLSWPSW